MKPDNCKDAGLRSPISGIVLIMKDTLAITATVMDYKGIGETGCYFFSFIYGYIDTKC